MSLPTPTWRQVPPALLLGAAWAQVHPSTQARPALGWGPGAGSASAALASSARQPLALGGGWLPKGGSHFGEASAQARSASGDAAQAKPEWAASDDLLTRSDNRPEAQALIPGCHVAIAMDGNGRWAEARGLPRSLGHRAGAKALRAVVEAAPGLGVGTLSVYAFSADNWKRPEAEVGFLMDLLVQFLLGEARRLAKAGVRLSVVGRRDRLPQKVLDAIEVAEALTQEGRALHLRVAVDYSGREAVRRHLAGQADAVGPPVDLWLRTGGEQRLSDFLLWEAAYAELFFEAKAWPDFGPEDLARALAAFRQRDRRFGGLNGGAHHGA